MECARTILIIYNLEFCMLIENLAGHEMDVRDLQFADETFDVAIDKGEYPCSFRIESKV